jgi:hypothetical protein
VNAVLQMALSEHARFAVHPQRACDLCDHGITTEGRRWCIEPHTTGGRRIAVHLARGTHMACGPDAHFLAFPGLPAAKV